jgi:hypothetical protein
MEKVRSRSSGGEDLCTRQDNLVSEHERGEVLSVKPRNPFIALYSPFTSVTQELKRNHHPFDGLGKVIRGCITYSYNNDAERRGDDRSLLSLCIMRLPSLLQIYFAMGLFGAWSSRTYPGTSKARHADST